MAVEAAYALLDLGRDNPISRSSASLPAYLSGGLTGLRTDAMIVKSQAVLPNGSSSHLEPSLESLDDFSSNLLPSVDSPSSGILGVQRIRKEQRSKLSVILSALQILKEVKVTATELLELVANGSQQGLAYFHSGFYATTNRDRVHDLLDTIWAHPKGKTMLEDWMRPHAIDLVCKSVHSEMEAAKPFLRMNVSDVTPEFVSNWDIRKTMEPIAVNITPMWTRVLNATTQPKVTLESTTDEEDDSRNRRTVCLRNFLACLQSHRPTLGTVYYECPSALPLLSGVM